MKKIIYVFVFLLLTNFSFAAGGSSSSNGNEANLYKEAKKFIVRAKKLEKKDKVEKALKLYSKAYDKLLKAYDKDKNNPDVLNYLGFTLRKTGDLENAEIFYLEGLKLDSAHPGINEYLGELYLETNRIELAKERLEALRGCDCEEFEELDALIREKSN